MENFFVQYNVKRFNAVSLLYYIPPTQSIEGLG